MLNNVSLKNVASYGDEEQQIVDLNIVNFIFGDNGSGKSTIARLIENDKNIEFKDSRLEWDAHGPIKSLVYNRHFIEDTLREKVKGVFTFGDNAGTKQDKLEEKIAERKKEQAKLRGCSRIIKFHRTDGGGWRPMRV
jgi:wobble nucleotide-excising tRNase